MSMHMSMQVSPQMVIHMCMHMSIYMSVDMWAVHEAVQHADSGGKPTEPSVRDYRLVEAPERT